MRILFTGASSFTGYWFARCLAAAGHEVVAIMRKPVEQYQGVRRARVERLEGTCRLVAGCAFGDSAFLNLVASESSWDVLCHHAADVTDYRSPEFKYLEATAGNTLNIREVLRRLGELGCRRVVATGSVFEGGEGAGSQGLRSFSPYGLSKELSWRIIEYFATTAGLSLGKFVIPNPFGPYEDPRFAHYLLDTWTKGGTATVRTPAYVRDNIHVSLLAKSYVRFVETLSSSGGVTRLNPSGYVESQGAFALRFTDQMRRRLALECRLELAHQVEFTEPRMRINTDPVDGESLGWDEESAWSELADYYSQAYGCARR